MRNVQAHGFRFVCRYVSLQATPESAGCSDPIGMSVNLAVGLLSGKAVTLEASLDETVATLKRRAETALSVGRGRLVDSCGRILDSSAPLKRVRLQDDPY